MPLTWCGNFLGCLGIDVLVMQPGELEMVDQIRINDQKKELETSIIRGCKFQLDAQKKASNSELAAYKKDSEVSNTGLDSKIKKAKDLNIGLVAEKEKLEAKCSEMTTKKDELETQAIDAGH
ncbi:hypothetical protein Glove_141g16 [Diversispora epigaea]|uniref:Uncharacterized protein n=1 Tax=Diversispora epigaea TaxID=1348612 RepID=A0A397IUY0_9GLOM|nr:hypothetical protein Glove_141g16 [Diversispora epigaea]